MSSISIGLTKLKALFPLKSNNLSDLSSVVTGRSNLGLSGAYGFSYTMMSGRYYYPTAPGSTTTNASHGIGTLRMLPCIIPSTVTLATIGGEVTSPGDAGSLVRLGIYADSGSGTPGSLVSDAGTIAGDSATVQEIACTATLTPGLYWFGAVVQNVTVTQPTLRAAAPQAGLILLSPGSALPGSAGIIYGYVGTGVTAALPASCGTPTAIGGTGVPVARIFFKVA